MQSVPIGWTAEERDTVRSISNDLLVSWKKFSTLGNVTFTIGVSMIGGNDVIGANPGAIGSPSNYQYADDSEYATLLGFERGLRMPTGGLSKAMAEFRLDNTSMRFTPSYMGGISEISTAEPLRSPFVINTGFEYGGISQTIPKFAGLINVQPNIDRASAEMSVKGADYIDFFDNKYLDQEVMFTGQRTDEVLENLLQGTLGMSTSQYELDYGINIIPFGLFEKGTRMSGIVDELVQAENGHFYQDEEGKFRFENRQHWDSSPYTEVQRVIQTSQVINAYAPDDDHIVNVVEISSKLRRKQPAQSVFVLPVLSSISIEAGETIEEFFEFEDPILELTDPSSLGGDSFYVGNSEADETGTDLSSSITFTRQGLFSKAVKYSITNSSGSKVYITQLVLSGRVAKEVGNLYYREQDDSSVTAYQERVLTIDNPYIQEESWAKSYAGMILNDYSEIENIQRIVIRALPELQLGDLISWQGRYWRIFNIRSTIEPSVGYTQELTLLNRTVTSYFRIGISTIGGDDKIAP